MESILHWPAVVAMAVVVRWLVAFSPHSGQGKPPMYGDFEAQRHWLEVTVNVPLRNWYVDSPDNDLMYWGLDYPPLTAYHSYAMGRVANWTDPDFVALGKSRGNETPGMKLFMRASAIVADVFVYFLPVCDFLPSYQMAAIALLFPGLILVDHGHFQYNAVSLGWTAKAVLAATRNQYRWAAFYFTLALNYKQMELYYALPFFFFLLGVSYGNGTPQWFPRGRRGIIGTCRVLGIGVVVLATTAVIWAPWLDSGTALDVVKRLFPLNRGLYESKVANFWCTLNIIYKVHTPEMRDTMVVVCMVATLLASLPSCLHLLFHPFVETFVLSLFNVSMSFFLFSFHVHEKSILLPALPACLLLKYYTNMSFFFLLMASSSMFPLYVLDNLVEPYIVLMVLFLAVYGLFRLFRSSEFSWPFVVCSLVFLFAQVLNFSSLFVEPPERYPDLFPVLISAYSAGVFVLMFIYFYYVQLSGLWRRFEAKERKAKLQ